MASSRFNPYRNWLGLEDPPSNYYELLGLPVGETDVARIRAAAIRTLSKLRRIQPGKRQERWKSLIDQLQAAQACLLTADAKSRYDQRLGLKPADPPHPTHELVRPPRPASPRPLAGADPMAPVEFLLDSAQSARGSVAEPMPESAAPVHRDSAAADRSAAIDPLGSQVGRRQETPSGMVRSRPTGGGFRRNRSSRHSLLFVYSVTVICFVGVVGTFLAVVQMWVLPAREQRQRQQAVLPQSARDLPLPADTDDRDAAASSVQPPLTDPMPRGGLSETNQLSVADATEPTAPAGGPLPEAPDRPKKSLVSVIPPRPRAAPSSDADAGLEADGMDTADDVHELLRLAFAATADARWPDADSALRQASVLAGETPLRDQVERFKTLRDYVQQYWKAAVVDGWEGLVGSELVIDGTRVFVVEADDRQLIIHREGQNQRFPLDELPTEIVTAIADRWFDERAATTPVFRGAFMLVKPQYSLQDVRDAWKAAESSGAEIGDLIQILDDLKSLGIRADSRAS